MINFIRVLPAFILLMASASGLCADLKRGWPQERVYLHFDNTSYMRGDKVLYKAYLVAGAFLLPSDLSNTLYVDMLNSDGKVVASQVLKMSAGQCAGELSLDFVPFTPGFYEIRAYTKYMMNFGEGNYFSKVLPVFDRTERGKPLRILKPASGRYENHRQKLKKQPKSVSSDRNCSVVDIDYKSDRDSVFVSMAGVSGNPLLLVFDCRGKLCGRYLVGFEDSDTVRFAVSRSDFPSGVVRATAFDKGGERVEELIFFNRGDNELAVSADVRGLDSNFKEIEITVRDASGNPFHGPVSVAVADAFNHVAGSMSMSSELLLYGDLKGKQSTALLTDSVVDSILRVSELSDRALSGRGGKFYAAEKAVGLDGTVVSAVRKIPKGDVSVSALLTHRNEKDSLESVYGAFVTDSVGRFSFDADLTGDWDMVLSTRERGKERACRIIIDRDYVPQPRAYYPHETSIVLETIPVNDAVNGTEEDNNAAVTDSEVTPEDIPEDALSVVTDEVIIKGKMSSKQKDIERSREKSSIFYDMTDERDKIVDGGEYVGSSVKDWLFSINKKFSKRFTPSGYDLRYQGKKPLYVIDYEQTYDTPLDSMRIETLYQEQVKSIYISEAFEAKRKYADPSLSSFELDMYGCVVFIETVPGRTAVPAGKGSRKTVFKGYTPEAVYYESDYQFAPESGEYRRTLYWNPNLMTDADGVARARFYCPEEVSGLKVSVEAMSSDGKFGSFSE